MRCTDRKIRDKVRNMPAKYKKIDTARNGVGTEAMAKHLEAEKGLRPLRVNARTTIFVTSDKLSEEYAEKYRKKMNLKA